jgi:uncharacterized protein YhfF
VRSIEWKTTCSGAKLFRGSTYVEGTVVTDGVYAAGETALVIRVPSAEPVVGRWREQYDTSGSFGVAAHVTVLYPYLPYAGVDDQVRRKLRDLFAASSTIDLRFTRCGRFPGVLYLAPEPDGPIAALTETVAAKWPEAPPYGGRFAEVVPHLTIADKADAETSAAIEAEVIRGLPVSARASGVTLLVFDGARWREDDFFPLGDPPLVEFAFPGPLRDELVGAILRGDKTTTTGLLADYEHAGDPLPAVGQWSAVVDSAGRRVAIIEVVDVRVVPIREIDEEFARAEGEGHTTVAEWRTAHERFWRGEEMSASLGATPVIDDDTLVVAERFRLLQRL